MTYSVAERRVGGGHPEHRDGSVRRHGHHGGERDAGEANHRGLRLRRRQGGAGLRDPPASRGPSSAAPTSNPIGAGCDRDHRSDASPEALHALCAGLERVLAVDGARVRRGHGHVRPGGSRSPCGRRTCPDRPQGPSMSPIWKDVEVCVRVNAIDTPFFGPTWRRSCRPGSRSSVCRWSDADMGARARASAILTEIEEKCGREVGSTKCMAAKSSRRPASSMLSRSRGPARAWWRSRSPRTTT